MALATTLLKGALGSLRKRPPYDGATLPARALTLPAAGIDARNLAAYAEVCGFPPTGGTSTLPATYPHLLGFPLAMRLMAGGDFPFPLLGLVHTGIALTQRRPLHADDRPQIRVHAESLAPHRRGSEFRMVTTARLDGEEVWSSRSTYLCRHRRPDDGGQGPREPAGRPADGADALPRSAEWRLPADLGRRYGAVSGDRNPIHLHPLTARPFGFPRAIAHGMWTFARCLAELAGDRTSVTVEARFPAPVLLPGTVVLHERDGTFALRGGESGGTGSRLHVSGTVTSARP